MKALIAEIRELIHAARQAVVHSVDLIQVLTNFEIGRRIVEHEQQGAERAEYGKALLKELSAELTAEFGRGFSRSNLEYMRKFYLTYQDRTPQISQMPSGKFLSEEKSQTSSGKLPLSRKSQTSSAKFVSPFKLSWSQYVFLISIDNPDERSFYEIEAAAQGWTLPELKRQFNSGLYERLALSRDKDGIRRLATEGQIVSRPEDLLKEPYVLEFLGLDEKARYSESDLESAIIDKLEHFLLELGKGFLFEARQKRFTFDEEHFFVDLVFYNRLLRCYVLIDLKIGKLTHQRPGADADVRQLLRPLREAGGRTPHHRHCSVQEEARRPGGNHPAQGRQYPCQGISALPARQGTAAPEAGGVGGRGGRIGGGGGMNATMHKPGWKTIPLRYVCQLNPPVDFDGFEEDDDVTFLPMDKVKRGYFIPNTDKFSKYASSYNPFKEGDIVLAKVTPCFENGNISIAENLVGGKGFGSSELFVIRPIVVDRKFLFYYFQSSSFKQEGEASMTGAGGLKRVSPDLLRQHHLPFPSQKNQRLIADYLDRETARIDALVAEKEKMLALLEEKRAALISSKVTRGLNPDVPLKPSGLHWLGDIPAHWEVMRLGFLVSLQGGSTPATSKTILETQHSVGITKRHQKIRFVRYH